MAPAVNPPADGIALDGLARGWAHIERATRDGHDRRCALADAERIDAGRDGLPEGPGLRAFAVAQPGRREPEAAPRHAERDVPAGGGALQRRGRIDPARAPPAAHGAGDGPGRRATRKATTIGRGDPRDERRASACPAAWRRWASRATCSSASSTARWPTIATRPTRASPPATTTARCSRPRSDFNVELVSRPCPFPPLRVQRPPFPPRPALFHRRRP